MYNTKKWDTSLDCARIWQKKAQDETELPTNQLQINVPSQMEFWNSQNRDYSFIANFVFQISTFEMLYFYIFETQSVALIAHIQNTTVRQPFKGFHSFYNQHNKRCMYSDRLDNQ